MSTLKKILTAAEVHQAIGDYVIRNNPLPFAASANTILRQQIIALPDGGVRVEIGSRAEIFDGPFPDIGDTPEAKRVRDAGGEAI